MKSVSFFPSFLLSVCVLATLPFPAGAAFGAEGEEPKAAEENQDKPAVKDAQAKRIELTGWVSEDEKYTNPVEAEVIEDGKQLKITFKGGEKDKSVVWKALDKMKLAAKGSLRLRVANPNEKAFEITVVVKTGKNYVFHESQRLSVKPSDKEFQEIVIDLDGATFKSEATQWKNTGTIADPGAMKSMQIGIYNEKESGSLIVSDLEIVAK